jgi:hypothetical protein
MTAPQILMQAAVARLGARLGSSLVDAAANLALVVQDAPEKVRQELQLFWEEVELEAGRLERDGQGGASGSASTAVDPDPGRPGDGFPRRAAAAPGLSVQEQIDALRAQVAGLGQRLDRRP